ncbi:MAG: hypothetical protein EBQ80_05245, partial [Proteobacteria bacterium]|nr:hypothetical protein [Pseudomonadota bacterium]
SQQSESEGGQTTDFNLTLTSPTTLTPAANTNLTLSPTLPIQGKILQGFHQSQGATAEGITLQGQAGSPVKAQVAGEVLYSGPFRQFGGLIIIKATSGHDILYGGLQTLTVNPGDTIKAGQPLGTLNPTGKLYWEIRRRGRPLNPLALNN